MKSLVVEGWRRSSHSYALVNQHQLVHLAGDPRFRLTHVDIPFVKPEWAHVDAGLHPQMRALIDSLASPNAPSADVIYRISWPLRIYGNAAARVFVFGTSEMQWLRPDECRGPSGTFADIDRDAVEVITPSNWSRAGFIASAFDERRVHVIPHGVDTALFRPPTVDEKRRLRADLQIPEGAHVFLSLGAMTWNKGIGPLIAAFAIYQERKPRAILLLKGGERLYGNLLAGCFMDAARLLGREISPAVQRAIRYSGSNMTLEEIASLYRASDVYVSPYRAEGFNMPVLEALASGVLPVVTAGGSTDDFCPDTLSVKVAADPTPFKEGGRYLEPSLQSLVACIERAGADESLRSRVAIDGPSWVAQRFTWAHVSRLLADRLAG